MPSKNRVTLATLFTMISAIGTRLDAIEGKVKTGDVVPPKNPQPTSKKKTGREPSKLALTHVFQTSGRQKGRVGAFKVADYNYVKDLPLLTQIRDVEVRAHEGAYLLLKKGNEEGLYVTRGLMNVFLDTRGMKTSKKLSTYFRYPVMNSTRKTFSTNLRRLVKYIGGSPVLAIVHNNNDYDIYSNWK